MFVNGQAPADSELTNRVEGFLRVIYPHIDAARLGRRLVGRMAENATLQVPVPRANLWDEADAIAISYGNSVTRADEVPLRTLHEFLHRRLGDSISGVHILPFFPFTSDDGFSVLNYLQVNDALGEWEDIEAIAQEFDLMADLVINHASARSRWFENFRKGTDPGKDYFVVATPGDDVSQVVRPRPSPLLQPVETADGEKLVWCTFSRDQVDMNFANPEVLCEFVNIIAHYLDRGVRIFRLDAVAFLWKQPGTPCIHLHETHQIIQLLRTLIEFRAPGAWVITETNVPNRDNLTYFGNGNEAHAIYNFSLPPLLVYTLLSGDCRHLKTWMMSVPPAQNGTTYLNFIASHDGIGLRPAEGLLAEQELGQLLGALERFGGRISMRAGADGRQHPYEANVSLTDALAGTLNGERDTFQLQRMVCAHAIMLALEGVPAIYIHSFLGTGNDYDRVAHSGQARSINRRVWDYDVLESELDNPYSFHARMFEAIKRLLRIRRAQPAFHPNATQFTLHLGVHLFGFWRQSADRRQGIFSISNVTAEPQTLPLSQINLTNPGEWTDLLSGTRIEDPTGEMTMQPYQTVWLSNDTPR